MYTLAILLYALCARVAAVWNAKARALVRGQRAAWKQLSKADLAGCVWVHAASLGEFEQGRPLMERLRRERPDQKILLTFFSPSGYEVRHDYPVADLVVYLPFDTPWAARRLVRLVKPACCVLVKYEFWRNYIEQLHRHDVPVYSVSSIFRPGQVFFRWWGHGYARCLRRITHFFVQNEQSRLLLRDELGLSSVSVAGDTRFDRVLDIKSQAKDLPLLQAFAHPAPADTASEAGAPGGGQSESKIMVCGSTWPPDEGIIIPYFNQHPALRLVLAPHVVSAEHLRQIEQQLSRPAVRYSELEKLYAKDPAQALRRAAQADCLIVDCYGLLSSIYRYGELAYVGGGFGVGIHNVPEAAVWGVPVLIGPNHQHFREAEALLRLGGCLEVRGHESFSRAIDRLLTQSGALQSAGRAAASYIEQGAGATEQIFRHIMHDLTHHASHI